MKAFHGDISIKNKYLDRVQAHIEAEEIIKGIEWKNGKGNSVGCAIHRNDYRRYETELGIPEWLAWLEEVFFEDMSNEKAKTWLKEFLEAIKPGMDLEVVKNPSLVHVLNYALKTFDGHKFRKVSKSVKDVIDLLENESSSEKELKKAGDVEVFDQFAVELIQLIKREGESHNERV